ncbi:hypothetical protein RRG08_025334 [Elysia crispata]|uniref:Uncharacterized protein n=1 Tax=Elysia crispata TaxID=231223 RepID=A0AAE1AAI8_9GAST|nr:hypothetical protein RRG08_025334 [Elysia crispata]
MSLYSIRFDLLDIPQRCDTVSSLMANTVRFCEMNIGLLNSNEHLAIPIASATCRIAFVNSTDIRDSQFQYGLD